MNKLFFLIIPLLTFFNDFSVDLELLKPADSKDIVLKVQVKNLSSKTISIVKPTSQDFKRDKIKALGSYIIEIEKLESGKYRLFTPTGDMDPLFEPKEYISLQKGAIFTDTLYIQGHSFSPTGDPKNGFPPGDYRLRISFNADGWKSSGQVNISKWLNYKIE